MLAFLLAPFYLLFNLYLFRRIMGWVRAWFPWFRKRKHWAVPAALYAFFALSFVLAFPLPAGRLKRALMLIGNYWLGVLLYLLLAVLLADGLRLLLVHGLKLRSLRSARMHRIAGCLCAAVILATSVGGVINARVVRVTPYEITVNKSAGSMESMKVVLLADLHLGYNVGLAQMERMVARVNEQDADAVVIAGDIFDNAWEAVEEPEQIAAVLRGIRSRYGVYAVYGNHDIEEPILAGFTFRSDGKKQSSPEMDAFLASANIRLLRDEAVLLGGEVYLYGRPDAQRPGRGIEVRKTPAELVEGLDAGKPILVLDHQPRELEALAAAGVDVDLCGHTHDGQMFPGNLTVRLFWENACGCLRVGSMHSIVTSGIGLFGPNMRVATRAEICPITIRFAERKKGNGFANRLPFLFFLRQLVPEREAEDQRTAGELRRRDRLAEHRHRDDDRHKRIHVAQQSDLLPRQLAQGGKIQAVGHACVEEAHDEQADPAARAERPQRYAAGRGDVGNENDDGG